MSGRAIGSSKKRVICAIRHAEAAVRTACDAFAATNSRALGRFFAVTAPNSGGVMGSNTPTRTNAGLSLATGAFQVAAERGTGQARHRAS